MAELAGLLGRAAEAGRLAGQAEGLKRAMNAKQWDAAATAFCDGLCANTTTRHSAFHASVHPLAFGAADDGHALAAWAFVRGQISASGGMPCGPYPAQFAVIALYANERDAGCAALELLTNQGTNSWGAMLRQGATMTMEMWGASMFNGPSSQGPVPSGCSPFIWLRRRK